MAGSPTQRTLKYLRDTGWEPWVVEVWNPHSKKRLDLWNFGDILAIKEGEAPLIVQVTSYSGVSARVTKIHDEPRAALWLCIGGRIEVHGWHKKPEKRGSKRMTWRARVLVMRRKERANGWSETEAEPGPQIP